MKVFTLIGVLTGLLFTSTGCVTPGYSLDERFTTIGRNWDYEGKQVADDVDHALLLRPASHLTWWNVGGGY